MSTPRLKDGSLQKKKKKKIPSQDKVPSVTCGCRWVSGRPSRGGAAPRSPTPAAVGGGVQGGETGPAEPPVGPAGPGHPALPRKGSGGRGRAAALPAPRKRLGAVRVSCGTMSVPTGSRRWGLGRPSWRGEGENEIREAESDRGAAGPGSRAGTPGTRRRAAGRAPASLPPHGTSLRHPQPLRKPGEMISPISLYLLSFLLLLLLFFFFWRKATEGRRGLN